MPKNKDDAFSVLSGFSVKSDLLSDAFAVTESIKNLTSGIARMQNLFVENPTIKKLGETLASVHKSCVFDLAEKFQNTSKIFDSFKTIFDNEVVKNLFKNTKYFESLKNSEWPLFHLEFQERERISNFNKDDFFPFLLDYYVCEYKEVLIDSWTKAPIIRSSRKPILYEALTLFDNHFYYGTCSILMCQLYGLAEDIDSYTKEHSLMASDEDIKGIDELYGIADLKKVPKEKRKLFQKLNFVRNHILLWDKTLTYINDFVLKSPKEDIDALNVPHRNKICHGEQTNFGTQEHALKAIFIVDALIQFSNEVYSSTQDCN